MSNTTYNVMLTGELNGERDETVAALAKLFKKTEEQIEKLIGSAPVAIKKQVEESVAEKYKKAIEACGAKVALESLDSPMHSSWSLEPTEEELAQKPAQHNVTGKASFESRDVESEAAVEVTSPNTESTPVTTDDNVYATPESELVDEAVDEYTELTLSQIYFSFEGRINRSTYWLKYFLPVIGVAILFVAILFVLPTLTAVLGLILLIPYIWATIAVSVKRLHDINLSGWWYVYLAVIPGVVSGIASFSGSLSVAMIFSSLSTITGLGLFIMNGFIPGTKGQNNYGNPQG